MMQKVSKILVLMNVVLSALFLATGVMVRTTRLDLKGQLRDLQAKVQALTTQKNDITTANEGLKKELETQTAKLESVNKENVAEAEKMKSNADRLVSDRDESQKRWEASKEEFGTSVAQQTELRMQAEATRTKWEAILENNTVLVQKRTTLNDELAQVTNNLETARIRNQWLEKRVKELEALASK